MVEMIYTNASSIAKCLQLNTQASKPWGYTHVGVGWAMLAQVGKYHPRKTNLGLAMHAGQSAGSFYTYICNALV